MRGRAVEIRVVCVRFGRCVCVCVCAPVGRSVGRSVGRTDGHAHKNRDYGCVAAAPGVERPEATRVGF